MARLEHQQRQKNWLTFKEIYSSFTTTYFFRGPNIRAYIAALRQAKFYPQRRTAAAAAGSTDHTLRPPQFRGAAIHNLVNCGCRSTRGAATHDFVNCSTLVYCGGATVGIDVSQYKPKLLA